MSTQTKHTGPAQQSTNPAIHQSINPSLFNQPRILQQLGHLRVARFLDAFADDLRQSSIALSGDGGKAFRLTAPPPSVAPLAKEGPLEPMTHYYFAEVADFLAGTENLPPRLLQAMSLLESAAAPEHAEHLNALIQSHIPDCTESHPLARALDLWLAGHLSSSSSFSSSSSISESSSSSSLAAPKSDEGGLAAPQPGEDRPSIQAASAGVSPAAPRSGSTLQSSTVQGSTVDACPSSSSSILNGNSHSDLTDSNLTDLEAIRSLASLSPMEYDRTRKKSARDMGIRVETLDAEVTRVRNQIRDDEAFNSALSTLHSPLPWPEPVNGAEVLTQIVERFLHYVILPCGAPEAFTLWSTHAHCFLAFIQSPRLNICSPEAGCGKTTALDVIATLTPRALRTENLTAPVLFRLVHQYQPTLLLDEVDTWLPQAEELRGLLNAGHKRGACAYRCEGEGNAVRPFRAFGPAVLAGIGQLTGTLHDRSIVVPLMKAQAGQILHRFDNHRIEIETELCRKLARWTSDNFAALKSCEPLLPPTAFNRLADNWRPLFAIAQIAGGDWPELALNSFNHLVKSSSSSFSSSSSISPPPVATISTASPIDVPQPHSQLPVLRSALGDGGSTLHSQLLLAIRQIFTQSNVTRLSLRQLAQALNQSQAVSFSPKSLGRRLRALGLKPRLFRLAGSVFKGYDLADFSNPEM